MQPQFLLFKICLNNINPYAVMESEITEYEKAYYLCRDFIT